MKYIHSEETLTVPEGGKYALFASASLEWMERKEGGRCESRELEQRIEELGRGFLRV
jgi:predicted Rdx family selenoprotein